MIKTRKGILVWASKDVGLQSLLHLIKINAPIDHVIVGTNNDFQILQLCEKKSIKAEVKSSKTYQNLLNDNSRWSWILSLWNPHIINKSLLDLADQTLNLHPGLLPICRGMDTAAWIIRKRLKAGVSLLEMDEGIDTGRIWAEKGTNYNFPIKGSDLLNILKEELICLFKAKWHDIYTGQIKPVSQIKSGTTFTRGKTEVDRVIDINKNLSAKDFLSWALAHDFYPLSSAEIVINDKCYKITVNLEEILSS